jgi:AcrR family transcriptional regulator
MCDTRTHLLDTAERLFQENGVEAVSLRTIVREAGQRNQSALQYHFGDRNGLMRALLDRRALQIEARRQQLVEAAAAQLNTLDLRAIFALFARAPFLLCREQADFREFLAQFGPRLLADAPTLNFDRKVHKRSRNTKSSVADSTGLRPVTSLPSFETLRQLLKEKLRGSDQELMSLRLENAQGLILLALSRRARLGGSFRGRKAEVFFNNLIDQVAGMLSAPVSAATHKAVTGGVASAGDPQ